MGAREGGTTLFSNAGLLAWVLALVAGSLWGWGPCRDMAFVSEMGDIIGRHEAGLQERPDVAEPSAPGSTKSELKQRIQELQDEALALRNQLVEYKYVCESAGHLKRGRQVKVTILAWDAELLPGTFRPALEGLREGVSVSPHRHEDLISLRRTVNELEGFVRQRKEQAERYYPSKLGRVERPPLRPVKRPVGVPAVDVQMGPISDWKGETIDKELLQEFLDAMQEAAEHCYVATLKKNPVVAGRLVLRVQINRFGRMNIGVVSERVRDPALPYCLRHAQAKRRFPKLKNGMVRFMLPFEFSTK